MSGEVAVRAFIDTNILVYTISSEPAKQQRAREVVAETLEVVVSAQVLREFTNVCLRQKLLPLEQVEAMVGAFVQAYEVVPVDAVTIRQAFSLKRRYGYT